MCELYIRFTYNSGDSPYQLSPEQQEALVEQCRGMLVDIPTPEELTPQAVRGMLEQYAVLFGTMKQDLEACL
jgi:hypothetical protein